MLDLRDFLREIRGESQELYWDSNSPDFILKKEGRGICKITVYCALLSYMVESHLCPNGKWGISWDRWGDWDHVKSYTLDFDPHKEELFFLVKYNPNNKNWDCIEAFASEEEAKAAF